MQIIHVVPKETQDIHNSHITLDIVRQTMHITQLYETLNRLTRSRENSLDSWTDDSDDSDEDSEEEAAPPPNPGNAQPAPHNAVTQTEDSSEPAPDSELPPITLELKHFTE